MIQVVCQLGPRKLGKWVWHHSEIHVWLGGISNVECHVWQTDGCKRTYQTYLAFFTFYTFQQQSWKKFLKTYKFKALISTESCLFFLRGLSKPCCCATLIYVIYIVADLYMIPSLWVTEIISCRRGWVVFHSSSSGDAFQSLLRIVGAGWKK